MDRTLVSLGCVALPLLLVSPNRINVVMPFGVERKANLQLSVRRPGLISTPEAAKLATATTRLIKVDNIGRGQAHVY